MYPGKWKGWAHKATSTQWACLCGLYSWAGTMCGHWGQCHGAGSVWNNQQYGSTVATKCINNRTHHQYTTIRHCIITATRAEQQYQSQWVAGNHRAITHRVCNHRSVSVMARESEQQVRYVGSDGTATRNGNNKINNNERTTHRVTTTTCSPARNARNQ